MKRNRFAVWLLCICMFLMTGCNAGQGAEIDNLNSMSIENTEKKETLTIYFFHDTACGACDGTKEFLDIVSEQISSYREARPYRINVKNVFKKEERSRAEEILEEQGLTMQDISFPMMLINGKVYEGIEKIKANIRPEFFSGMVSEILYFYRDDCQECIELSDFMESLSKTAEVGGVELPLVQRRFNSREGNNGDKVRELFASCQVPEEDQMVPIIFLGNHYLAGMEEIEEKLMLYLADGYGLKRSEA